MGLSLDEKLVKMGMGWDWIGTEMGLAFFMRILVKIVIEVVLYCEKSDAK